jgi:glycerol-3-phosphate acyltransferase PlsY
MAVLVSAYLLGSIPTGYLVARARGIDTVGSGNIGATNAFRVLGKPAGLFVLVVDGLKGWIACALLGDWVYRALAGPVAPPWQEYPMVLAGVAVILGHNFTCWLKFKGGKGIATSAGALAALVPKAFLAIFVVWVATFGLTRIVSLASLAAAASLPIATWLLGYSFRLVAITTGMSVLAIYKHRSNIQRLLNGTERRIQFRAPRNPDLKS